MFAEAVMVIREKSLGWSRSKYSWCEDTHRHTTWHNIHDPTANGGMVTPRWTLTEAPLLDSLHCPPKETSLLKFTTPQRLSHYRLLQDVAGYSKFTFLFASPVFLFFFFKKFLTCFCFYLFTSRSERVAWWDKDAGEPHPSTHRPTQTGAVHMSQAKNVLWWFLCYI